MKPNWKAYAKEAYRRGYERGKREVSGWIPSRDPPAEPGRYECAVEFYDYRGNLCRDTRLVVYDADIGEWDLGTIAHNGYFCTGRVTHWKSVALPPKGE